MAGIHHRSALVAQAADALQDGVAALGVDRHRGLVKEDELGLVCDAAGNVEAARQSARKLAGTKLGKVAQPDKVDRLVHQRAAALAVVNVEAAEIVDVLAHRELVKHRHLLRHHADAALEVVADLAGGDAQVKVVERNKIVIALDEVFDMDDVCHEAALLLVVARYDFIIAGAGGAHQ